MQAPRPRRRFATPHCPSSRGGGSHAIMTAPAMLMLDAGGSARRCHQRRTLLRASCGSPRGSDSHGSPAKPIGGMGAAEHTPHAYPAARAALYGQAYSTMTITSSRFAPPTEVHVSKRSCPPPPRQTHAHARARACAHRHTNAHSLARTPRPTPRRHESPPRSEAHTRRSVRRVPKAAAPTHPHCSLTDQGSTELVGARARCARAPCLYAACFASHGVGTFSS
jgi:hypothetical protein